MRTVGPLVIPLSIVVGLAAGCSVATPLTQHQIREIGLTEIHEAFELTVARAHCDPRLTWHSGWWGNVRVYLGGGDHRGLCYEWQWLIHRGVVEAAKRLGWRSVGITINRGTPAEHHAVLVYDPMPDRASLPERPKGAYVLDAWSRGKADVYSLESWLEKPLLVFVPAQLEAPNPGQARR